MRRQGNRFGRGLAWLSAKAPGVCAFLIAALAGGCGGPGAGAARPGPMGILNVPATRRSLESVSIAVPLGPTPWVGARCDEIPVTPPDPEGRFLSIVWGSKRKQERRVTVLIDGAGNPTAFTDVRGSLATGPTIPRADGSIPPGTLIVINPQRDRATVANQYDDGRSERALVDVRKALESESLGIPSRIIAEVFERCAAAEGGRSSAVVPSLPARAPESGVDQPRCRTTEPGRATIRGRFVPLADSISLARSVGFLYGDRLAGSFGCRVQADSRGHLEFRGIPPGDYELRFSQFGAMRSERIPVHVGTDTLVVLDLPQFGTNPILFCLQESACAGILTRKPTAEREAVTEEEELALLGHRVALALASPSWRGEEPWAVCVDPGAHERLLSALKEVHPRVVPKSECEFAESPDFPGDRLRHRWLLRDGGRPATVISAGEVSREADGSVSMPVSYHVGSLWAAGFRCVLERANDVWFPKACSVAWMS